MKTKTCFNCNFSDYDCFEIIEKCENFNKWQPVIKNEIKKPVIKSEGFKTCSKCKKIKNYSEFHHDKKSKDGYFGRCKKCQSKANKKYRNINKENK